MDMTGETVIPAPRERVWAALNDPDILKSAIPGCDEIVKQSETEMTAKVTAKVGPVKAKFTGEVTLSDLDPPSSYTISGEGKGGPAGFAKGGAKVSLSDQDGGTLLSYEVHANVGGKLAQIGSRLIDSTAKKMADDFFTNFSAALSNEGAPAATPETQPAEAVAATDTSTIKETTMSNTPQGVPDENVYESAHWTIYLGYALALVATVLFFMNR